jgi:hypothetical protein
MKKNLSIFKKISLFKKFRKVIKENEVDISQRFNLRIDSASRLYTVLNIPQDLIGEAYALKKSDTELISENYIRKYSNDLSEYLNSKGLSEMYSFYKVDKVDRYSYLLVFGFSLFRSNKYYDILYYRILPILGVITIATLFYFLY